MQDVVSYLKAHAKPILSQNLADGRWSDEKVHEVRISTRRLRMALWWIEQATRDKTLRKARRSLGQLGRILGERRQWDVLAKDAKIFGLDPAKIEGERNQSVVAMDVFRKSHEGRKVAERLERALRHVPSLDDFNVSRPLQKLRKPLKYWLKHPPKTKLEFHECRITLKKTRYVMEALGLDVKELKKVQDWLGEAHDLEILQATLGASKKIADAEVKARQSASRVLPRLLADTLSALRTIH